MQRANLRYAHFKQVFEENLHYYFLNQKLVAKDNEKKFQIQHGLSPAKLVQEQQSKSKSSQESSRSFINEEPIEKEETLQEPTEGEVSDLKVSKFSNSFKHKITTLIKKISSKKADKDDELPSERTYSDRDGDMGSPDASHELQDVRNAIMREFREFKLSIRKNEYPLELKKTVHLLSGGYMDILKRE